MMRVQFFVLVFLAAALFMACASTGMPSSSSADNVGGKASNPSKTESAKTKEVSSIEGHEWKLVEVFISEKNIGFKRDTLPEAMAYFFTLKFDGQNISGVGAPNRYSAPYTLGNEQTVNIKLMISTKMASLNEPENLNEHEYFTFLQNAYFWKLANNSLELLSKTKDGGEVRLVFSL